LDAITHGDEDAAEQAMRAHLVHTGRLLVAHAARDLPGSDDPERIWAAHIDARG